MKALTLLKQDIQQWNQWRASCNYEPCSLAHANLSNGYFFEGDFRGVDLSGAILEGACLIGANFQGVSLTGASLQAAYLDKANLTSADIRGADFSQAHLAAADFRDTKLEDAIFTNANIAYAIVDNSQQVQEKKAREPKVLSPIVIKKKREPSVLKVTKKRTSQQSIEQTKDLSVQQSIEQTKDLSVHAHKETTAVVEERETLPTSHQPAQQLFDQLSQTIGDSSKSAISNTISVASASSDEIPLWNVQPSTRPPETTAKKLSSQSPRASHSRPSQQQPAEIAIRLPWLRKVIGISAAVGLVSALVMLSFIRDNRLLSQASTALPTAQASESSTSAVQATAELATAPSASSQPRSLVSSITESSAVWAISSYSVDDRNVIVSGTETGEINFRNQESGQTIKTLKASNDAIRDIAIAHNTDRLISSSGDGIKVWDLQTLDLLHSLPSDSPVWSVALTPDESRFVSSAYDGTITLWQLETGEPLYRIEDKSTVWSVAVAPDGESFVSGGSDRTIRHWDVETGQLIQTFTGHTDDVRALAVSSDGATLASGSWDKTVKLWSLQTGRLQASLEGHRDRVVSLSISPSGEILASGSTDNTVKQWDLTEQKEVESWVRHSDWILSTAFTPQDSTLITGGKDAEIRAWQ